MWPHDISGLQVIDISDPTTPTLAGSYNTPGTACRVAIAGDYVYVADGYSGLQVIEVFQRRFCTQSNIAQSLIIDKPDELIFGARITTTQVDSIRWEVSADSGVNWVDILPDNTWQTFTSPGSNLPRRSTHVYLGGGINPACTDLEIEWLDQYPFIDSIEDIPNDQGG